MNEVSNLFVCLMGMGTTFVGLICIIFLTMLMGKVMQKLEKPEPPKAAPVPAAPAVPADGLTAEVSKAVGQVMTDQNKNLTVIQNHIGAGMNGVSNATIAYNNGQYDMATTFQTEMTKAAESGDFQYFVDHGYQG